MVSPLLLSRRRHIDHLRLQPLTREAGGRVGGVNSRIRTSACVFCDDEQRSESTERHSNRPGVGKINLSAEVSEASSKA